MYAERKIDVAPWVSCRSYFLNEEHKSIIYNNKIGKSLVLESWSSIIWSHIVDGLDLVEIHERIGKESNCKCLIIH